MNIQKPISNLSVEIDNSRLSQEIEHYSSFGYSGLLGFKKDFIVVVGKRVGISFELKYSIQQLRSQSFEFNVFGNADPKDFNRWYTNFGGALGLSYYLDLNQNE